MFQDSNPTDWVTDIDSCLVGQVEHKLIQIGAIGPD